MPPVYKFRAPDQSITDITEYFRLYKLDVATNAEEGSVAQSTVQADDPDGTFDIVGHRIFQVTEDTATGSNTAIYTGYTAARRISRGESTRTGTARVWDIDLVDLNSVLSRRVMTGNDCNRTAETDVARVQWLLGTNEASIIDDSLYLNTSGAVAMDAVDYRGQRFSDVLDDAAQASGKNYFVWLREETGVFSLWYDFASSTSYSSPLRLTNDLADVDSALTFAISNDTQLSRSPDRVNSGAYLPYDGGSVYEQSAATSSAFAQRDAVMPAENVKSATKATARASRYLGTMNTEEDVITTTILLPAAKVNFLMQGMRVQFKATHLPGYETYTWLRLLNRSVLQVSEEFYEVKCEMSMDVPVVVPEAPPGTTSTAVLYQPVNTHTGLYNRTNEVAFDSSGDTPPSGYPLAPTGSAFTKNTYTGGFFLGWTVNSTGTIAVTFTASFGEVFAVGDRTASFLVKKNGATVATVTVTTTLASGTYWSRTATASTGTIAATAGDIITFEYAGDLTLSGRYPKVPAGSGGGGLLASISGTF